VFLKLFHISFYFLLMVIFTLDMAPREKEHSYDSPGYYRFWFGPLASTEQEFQQMVQQHRAERAAWEERRRNRIVQEIQQRREAHQAQRQAEEQERVNMHFEDDRFHQRVRERQERIRAREERERKERASMGEEDRLSLAMNVEERRREANQANIEANKKKKKTKKPKPESSTKGPKKPKPPPPPPPPSLGGRRPIRI
jgi:hypothetical protein